MKKLNFLLIFLIFSLAIAAVASEDVEDSKTQFDLIFNVVDFGDYIEVNVNLPSDAQGFVNYTINGESHEVKIVNGEAKLNITDLEPGQYDLKANYSGDDVYMSVENKTIIIIKAPEKPADNGTNDTNGTNAAGGDVASDDKNNAPTDNGTSNQTQPEDNKTDGNVTTTVDNSPPPKKPPEKPPLDLDAKTGLPIVLVIIAAIILIVVRKYQF